METFPMDLGDEHTEPPVQQSELMDVDTDWLDRLISSELDHSTPASSSVGANYESLLNNNITDPLDLFNIDDNDFKIAAEFSWDRLDFAAWGLAPVYTISLWFGMYVSSSIKSI